MMRARELLTEIELQKLDIVLVIDCLFSMFNHPSGNFWNVTLEMVEVRMRSVAASIP